MRKNHSRVGSLALLLFLCSLGGHLMAEEPESPIPSDPHEKAAYLIRAGKYEKAIPIYQQLTARDPRNPDPQRELMWALWKAGRSKETLQAASALLLLKPKDTETLNLLAKALAALEDKRKALAIYEESLAINPDQLSVRLAAIRLRIDMKNLAV